MKTYNMNFISDKKEYWVSEEQSNFIVVFTDKSKAHQFKLALALGTSVGPWDSVENYTLVSSREGSYFYKVGIQESDPGWKEESCCQSGCPGCEWTIAQEEKKNG